MPKEPTKLTRELWDLVPASLARAHRVVPINGDGPWLELLTVDPANSQLAEDLTFALGRDVRLVECEAGRLERLLREAYGHEEGTPTAKPAQIDVGRDLGADETASTTELAVMAGQPPIVAYVNLVIAQAIRDRASDVHFEPFERQFRVRVRVDGALHELPPPPRAYALPVISRVKVLANLNIAERRVPQDGRIRTTLEGRAVDLRVSTLPTQFGESVVLRVLDQSAIQLDLNQIGLPDDVLPGVRDVLQRPNGILLVTGPTGSGKTTTLYSGLRTLNTSGSKLLTIEDPVEYEIEGIMQVPINPVAGLTFASALRSFLRQDPDVIMVGEIRDLETAQIAIQASLTGHLVLSTLHTNDAPAAMTRLLDMGVQPFLLAATVEAVLAQRLVRRICPHCRGPHEPGPALLARMGINFENPNDSHFFQGGGCLQCGQTGYRGRMGIFEWLVPDETVRKLVTARAPMQLLRQRARDRGMRTLREDALRAVYAGQTTLGEIARYT